MTKKWHCLYMWHSSLASGPSLVVGLAFFFVFCFFLIMIRTFLTDLVEKRHQALALLATTHS